MVGLEIGIRISLRTTTMEWRLGRGDNRWRLRIGACEDDRRWANRRCPDMIFLVFSIIFISEPSQNRSIMDQIMIPSAWNWTTRPFSSASLPLSVRESRTSEAQRCGRPAERSKINLGIRDQRSTSSTGKAFGKVHAKRDSRVIVRWLVAFSMNTSRLNTWRRSLIFEVSLKRDQRSNLDVHGREQNAKCVNLTDEIARLHLNFLFLFYFWRRFHLPITIQGRSLYMSDVKQIRKGKKEERNKVDLWSSLPESWTSPLQVATRQCVDICKSSATVTLLHHGQETKMIDNRNPTVSIPHRRKPVRKCCTARSDRPVRSKIRM